MRKSYVYSAPSGKSYLIAPDHAAGRRNRFTVYVVPASPSSRVRIIGRELPLGHARQVVADDAN